MTMHRYIISHGWHGTTRVIEAASLAEAEAVAVSRSLAQQLDPNELAATTWAKPYSTDLARECDLLPYDEPRRWWG